MTSGTPAVVLEVDQRGVQQRARSHSEGVSLDRQAARTEDAMIMWVLSGFDAETEWLQHEIDLPAVGDDSARALLNLSPDVPLVGEFPLPREQARQLAPGIPDEPACDWFLGRA